MCNLLVSCKRLSLIIPSTLPAVSSIRFSSTAVLHTFTELSFLFKYLFENQNVFLFKGQTLTDTEVSTLVETWAALRASPVHGPHTFPVRCLIADPGDTQIHTHTHYMYHTVSQVTNMILASGRHACPGRGEKL